MFLTLSCTPIEIETELTQSSRNALFQASISRLQKHVLIVDHDLIGAYRPDRWQAQRPTGLEVKSGPVTWTFDFLANHFATKKFIVIVRTAVLDGPKSSFGAQDQHVLVVEIDDFLFVQWKIGQDTNRFHVSSIQVE
jgi:hypothetical protein